MLSDRQLLIFKCIVEEFIATAEPVGSKALMTKYQLSFSSATIRNEMKFLEDIGYLDKTHTSSGRVPSIMGYQFYVDNLTENFLDENIKNQVASIFSDPGRGLTEIIHESCEMLSEVTNLTSIALGSDSDTDMLTRITMIPLDEHRVTTIIVTSQGHVENKVFTVKNELDMESLVNCINTMNDMLVGTPINRVVEKLETDVKPVLLYKIKIQEELFNAFLDAFVKFASSNIYLSGKENILYQPEFNDVNKIRKLVSAFENNQVLNLLEPINQEEGVSVKIGTNLPSVDINNVSVISASFKTGQTSKGSISVIGPTRMPYKKVVALVDYISKNIEKIILEEKDNDKNKD